MTQKTDNDNETNAWWTRKNFLNTDKCKNSVIMLFILFTYSANNKDNRL
jgi:hypothetical protein